MIKCGIHLRCVDMRAYKMPSKCVYSRESDHCECRKCVEVKAVCVISFFEAGAFIAYCIERLLAIRRASTKKSQYVHIEPKIKCNMRIFGPTKRCMGTHAQKRRVETVHSTAFGSAIHKTYAYVNKKSLSCFVVLTTIGSMLTWKTTTTQK